MSQFLPPEGTPALPPEEPTHNIGEAANALIHWFNAQGLPPKQSEAVMHRVLAKILVDRMSPKPSVAEMQNIIARSHTDLVHEVNERIYKKYERRK